MLSLPRRRQFSFREYLELEEASNTKHEYWAGEIYAMAGGSPQHAALSMSLGAALLGQLRGGPCRVYSSDLRVRVLATGLATYPDVTVVCGPLHADPDSDTTVTNPTLVVEVLSPSTASYDQGEKLEHYQQIDSLQACLFVSPDDRTMTLIARAEEGWHSATFAAGDTLPLRALVA